MSGRSRPHNSHKPRRRTKHATKQKSKVEKLPKPRESPKMDPEDLALLSDPRIFRTQAGGIGFACGWKIDWSQYDEERGTPWLFTAEIYRGMSQNSKKWKPCFALSRSALEQAAYEEMGRREAWDKEYESHFHLFSHSESKKKEDHRRAAWDDDYCNLLVPVYSGQSTKRGQRGLLCKPLEAMSCCLTRALCFNPCVLSSWKKGTSTRWLIDVEPVTSVGRRPDMPVFEGYCNEKFVF